MATNRKYKLIAAFLLIVFSTNSVAGFACSIGVNMGYNARHHAYTMHMRGKEDKCRAVHHTSNPISNVKLTGTKEDCCSGAVHQFQQLDKALAHNPLLLQPPVTYIDNHLLFTYFCNEKPGLTVNSRFQFVRRSCFLNDIDIQTAIRHFRI